MSLNNKASRIAAILAPAAAILIAVGFFMAPGQKSAFAAALEHLRLTDTIIGRISMGDVEVGGVKINAEGKMYVSSEHGMRVEMFMTGMPTQVQYTPPEGPSIIVTPATKTWMELDLSAFAPDQNPAMAATPAKWLDKMKELEDDAARELGADTIDGQEVLGFEIAGTRFGYPADSSALIDLWVYAESGVAVQMKITVPMPQADGPMSVVIDQFEWNTPVDPELFTPDIPEDFVKLDVKFATPSEETLLHALRTIGELSGGRYTKSLQSVTTIAEIPPLLTDEAKKKLSGEGQQGMMQMALEISSGCQFYMNLVREGREPEYFGETVTAADAEKVLLRWNLEEGGTRVIYGDLRVETLDD